MEKKLINRVISLVLALCVLFGCMPAGALAEGGQVQSTKKIADAPTLNSYKEYFTEDSTAYAGLVWTDKSVFTDEDALKTALELKGNVLPTVHNCTSGHPNHKQIKLTENENFLVALSTTASNKSIDGYRERPTDTIFVLDITGSMDSGTSGTERIQKLVPAVNNAITMLMDNNRNNRVGVVVYSKDHESVQELLELGRYTAQAIEVGDKECGEYIVVASDGDHIWVGPTVCKEGSDIKENPQGENGTKYQVEGATYIQGGLQMAKAEFGAVTDVKAEIRINGELQSTVRRIPALVLVTDGNPTMSTNDYASRGAVNNNGVATSLFGSGSDGDSTVGMGFLCQLTALWVKEEMGKRYNEVTDVSQLANVSDPVIPLFYTLGIQIQDRDAAKIALDPAGNKHLVSELWNEFNTSASAQMKVNVSKSNSDGKGQDIDVTRDANIQNYRYSPDQIYVDEAFEIKTNDSAEYEAALEAIVEAIKLQSGYTPTMLQTSDGFYDGYVTFSDDVGEHMEFKDVKGLVLKDRLFSGEHAAEMFTADLGDRWATEGNGYQIINAIATRLNLSTVNGSEGRTLAIDLIDAAYNAKLLGPKTHVQQNGVEVGNSFGWFADEDMNILPGYGENQVPLAFWNWKDDPKGTADGAAYRVRSYIFYDEIKSDNAYSRSITNLNTIFMSVQVREHIQSGKVSLVWRIPSRLIPMNEYVVSLSEGNTDVVSITLNEGDKEKGAPIRLVYEVGPKEGYRSYQIEETMRNLKKESFSEVAVQNLETDIKHIVKAEDGVSYYLYSNAVDKTLEGNYQSSDHHVSQEDNTVSYFKPSNQNERYRFSVETMIYSSPDDKDICDDATLNPANTYWYKQYVFAHESAVGDLGEFADLNGDGYGIITVWHQVDSNLVRENSHQGHEHIVRKNDGTWAVQPNTAEYPADAIQAVKEKDKHAADSKPNPTDTLTYSDYAILEMVETDEGAGYPHDHIDEGDYIISSVLGNNGRLIVTPDTGIAIRKVVENPDDLTAGQRFDFVITRTDEGAETDDQEYRIVIENDQNPDTSFRFDENHSFEFSLADGETAHLLGLPVGSTYTITEMTGDNHKLETITVVDRYGRQQIVSEAKDIEVSGGSQVYVTFDNEVSKDPGFTRFTLRKIVSHNYKHGFTIPEDAEFLFQLTFEKEEDGKNIYAGDVLYDMDGNAYALDEQGMTADVTLIPDQEIVFTGLEEGAKVTVVEIVGPGVGYKIKEIAGENVVSFELVEENMAEAVIGAQKNSTVIVHNMYVQPVLPDTGDNSRLILWTALMALCGIAAIGMRKRRDEY